MLNITANQHFCQPVPLAPSLHRTPETDPILGRQVAWIIGHNPGLPAPTAAMIAEIYYGEVAA